VRRAARVGLRAPLALSALTLVVLAALGPRWALAVLAAGAAAIVGFHLWHLDRLSRWAAASLDAPVPEGRGCWAAAFAALHRRARVRRAYQRDLAQTIERFRNAAAAVPDGMVVLDGAHRIRWMNPKASEQLHIDPTRDVGQPLANFVRQPEFVHYLEARDYSEAITIEAPREPGQTLSLQIVPFGGDERLLISHDITRVEAAARMRRDFIANVSHELKTPLTVVAGFLETIQELNLEPRQRDRYLDLMREQTGNMRRLVDDLLTLSALESEQGTRTEATFAVLPLVAEVLAEARALSGSRHTVGFDPGEAATVTGNRDELASAFTNLVSNAVRYTPDGGTITLSWRVDESGRGAFSVTDTGIGIAPEHIPRLTERFYRVDRSRSRATGGTGLGLAIVKHVLLRHQAEFDVVSEPGKGSTFTVLLPAQRVQRSEAAAPGPNSAGVGPGPEIPLRAATSSATPR
jgi:two-component system phosphate regulon sensor histidine kinase PhoR